MKEHQYGLPEISGGSIGAIIHLVVGRFVPPEQQPTYLLLAAISVPIVTAFLTTLIRLRLTAAIKRRRERRRNYQVAEITRDFRDKLNDEHITGSARERLREAYQQIQVLESRRKVERLRSTDENFDQKLTEVTDMLAQVVEKMSGE